MITTALLLASMALADNSWGGRPITNRELRNEKRGRVVDASTSAGIPGVKVIAVWKGSSFGIGGSSGGCVLQRIVTTDADGKFTIPSVAKDLDVSGRGSHGFTSFAGTVADYTWILVVFKPGYVREGDMESFKITDPTRAGFAWSNSPPDVSNGWGTVWIKDIRMQRADTDFQETVLYYAALSQATTCAMREIEQPGLHEIREEISQIIRPLPCHLPSKTPVNAKVAMGFSSLLGDIKFFENMKIDGQKTWPWTDTTAGTVCRALRSEGNTP